MDVREYVIALSVICRPSKYLKTLQLAFRVRLLLLGLGLKGQLLLSSEQTMRDY